MVNPNLSNIDKISFLTMAKGCRVPKCIGSPGKVRSKPDFPLSESHNCSFNVLILFSAAVFNSLRALPISFFCSTDTFLKSSNRRAMVPFLLKCLILNCSTCSSVSAVKAFISDVSSLILFNIVSSFNYRGHKVRKNMENVLL